MPRPKKRGIFFVFFYCKHLEGKKNLIHLHTFSNKGKLVTT
ncbi:MAG: hypothetical protein ACI9N1_000100 [Flavobacteriales bacterium]|jgi:hypothetical protein